MKPNLLLLFCLPFNILNSAFLIGTIHFTSKTITQLLLNGLSVDLTIHDGREMGDYTIVFNSSGSIKNFNVLGDGKSISSVGLFV